MPEKALQSNATGKRYFTLHTKPVPLELLCRTRRADLKDGAAVERHAGGGGEDSFGGVEDGKSEE